MRINVLYMTFFLRNQSYSDQDLGPRSDKLAY
jgi:hypothetical protein